MLPAPTTGELSRFTGRPADVFGAFAEEALAQATLLFSVLTQRGEYPTDPTQRQLALNAILEMADRIYLEQPHAATKASPFASESIGSYSYSKSATFQKARQNERTDLFWWELALDELTMVDRSLVASGSVSALDRDDLYTDTETGDRLVLGPADFHMPAVPFDVNAEKYPRDPL